MPRIINTPPTAIDLLRGQPGESGKYVFRNKLADLLSYVLPTSPKESLSQSLLNTALPYVPTKNMLVSQRIKEGMFAAIRDPKTGKVYSGLTHRGILEEIRSNIKEGAVSKRAGESLYDRFHNLLYVLEKDPTKVDLGDLHVGFLDKKGNFITREQADKLYGSIFSEELVR